MPIHHPLAFPALWPGPLGVVGHHRIHVLDCRTQFSNRSASLFARCHVAGLHRLRCGSCSSHAARWPRPVYSPLSSILKEAITIKNGAAEQQNFDDYSILRFSEAPKLETWFIESHADPHGLGEAAVGLTAPAVANAIFAATGKRLHRMPFRMDESVICAVAPSTGEYNDERVWQCPDRFET